MKKLLVVVLVDVILWAGMMLMWASVCLPGCAVVHSQPVTGALGRSCQLPVTVVCAKNLPDSDCEHVRLACAHVNARFGTELLRWQVSGPAHVTVAQGDIRPVDPFADTQEAMRTRYQVYTGSGCFAVRLVETGVAPNCCTWGTRQTQFRHELLHALGLSHNEWDPESVMAPGVPPDMTESRGMDAADIAGLHAIYERSFGF